MKTLLKEVSQLSQDKRHKPTIRYLPNLPLLPRHLRETFCLLDKDVETCDWLAKAREVNLIKHFFAALLRVYFSRTTANGITGRGTMFVFSTSQVRMLLTGESPENVTSSTTPLSGNISSRHAIGMGDSLPNTQPLFDRLLDIGAGDGGVTSRLAPLFSQVFATEYSWSMRWRLWWRGYSVVDYRDPFHIPVSSLAPSARSDADRDGFVTYDVISCLNVLDRADTPVSLLRSIHSSLRPNGILILAVVLPWCPFVEDGVRQRPPTEPLPMSGGECCKGATFEASLERLVDRVLVPCGFKVERWTKAPYLCEGNLKLEYALLHDALLILRKESS